MYTTTTCTKLPAPQRYSSCLARRLASIACSSFIGSAAAAAGTAAGTATASDFPALRACSCTIHAGLPPAVAVSAVVVGGSNTPSGTPGVHSGVRSAACDRSTAEPPSTAQ